MIRKVLIIFALVLPSIVFGCQTTNDSVVSSTPDNRRRKTVERFFNAGALMGKSPMQVQKILGNPTDSWFATDRNSSDYLIQTYNLGNGMTVEFYKNRIKSFVIFFEETVDSETAHTLVGLEPGRPTPNGISNVSTAQNWIKVFY